MADQFKFIRSELAFTLANIQSLIREATPVARSLTTKPLPHIAIGRGSSDQIYLGFDVELPDLPPNFSIHAAQFVVVNLIRNEEPKLSELAITDNGTRYYAPCGHCCQFLQEIHKGNEIQTMITEFMPLDTFLPQRFSPYNAVTENVPNVLDRRFNDLTITDSNYPVDNSDLFSMLRFVALGAANKSYAPYSNAPSGVVLKDRSKNLYVGSYIESVASYPSLGPVQAALIDFVIGTGGREFKNIIQAVLVETRSRFRQEDTAKMILQKIAPNCDVKVFHCSHPAESS